MRSRVSLSCFYCSVIRPVRQLLKLESQECSRQKCVEERERVEQVAREAAIFNAKWNGTKPHHPQPEVKADYIDPGEAPHYSGNIKGWDSYKFHESAPVAAGLNRSFFQYAKLSTSQAMPKDYVTQYFNAYCAEAGIECTVTMDPKDFRQLFHFKNMGDRLVKIEHAGDKRFLEPGEQVTLAVPTNSYDLNSQPRLPKITALNGGLG